MHRQSLKRKGVRTMLEMNGDIGKARERKLRDRQKRRQEEKEAMTRENVKRNQRKDGETDDQKVTQKVRLHSQGRTYQAGGRYIHRP